MAVVRICDIVGCDKFVRAKGLCSMHHSRWKKHGDPHIGGINVTGRGLSANRLPCSLGGCEKPAAAKTVCSMHYARMRTHGTYEGGRNNRAGFAGWLRDKICTVPGCEKPHQSLGYCGTHYQRHRDGRLLEAPVVERFPGEKRIDPNGYVVWSERGHVAANRFGVVLEHRAVLAQTLGRPLLPGENAHHRNGNRSDNRPENLELWVTLQPSGQRPEDLLAYAYEIIARYGSEAA